MKPDAIFNEPLLAAVYDTFDGGRGDLDVYAAIVDELQAKRVLDAGCGTGSLAVLLAARGCAVIGADPAEASLAIARSKDSSVHWVQADAANLPEADADLVIMTGNVAQVFLSDDEWAEVLRSVHAALRPGGHFVFETRRPEYRAWEEWAGDTAPLIRDVPGIGPVERTFTLTSVNLPYVSFRYTYRFGADTEKAANTEKAADTEKAANTEKTSESTLRFRDRAELEAALTAAGFRVRDVREAPDRPGREYVFLTEKAQPVPQNQEARSPE